MKKTWYWQIERPSHNAPGTRGYWTQTPMGEAGQHYRKATSAEEAALNEPDWPTLTPFSQRIDHAIELG